MADGRAQIDHLHASVLGTMRLQGVGEYFAVLAEAHPPTNLGAVQSIAGMQLRVNSETAEEKGEE